MILSFFIISSRILLIGSEDDVSLEIICMSFNSESLIVSNGNSLISPAVNGGSLSLSVSTSSSSSSVSVIPTGGLSFIDRASLGGVFGILSDSGGGINGASLPLKDYQKFEQKQLENFANLRVSLM